MRHLEDGTPRPHHHHPDTYTHTRVHAPPVPTHQQATFFTPHKYPSIQPLEKKKTFFFFTGKKKLLAKKLKQTSQRAITMQKKMAQRSLKAVASKVRRPGSFFPPFSIFDSLAPLCLTARWHFYGFIAPCAFGEVRRRGHLWPRGETFGAACLCLKLYVCVSL